MNLPHNPLNDLPDKHGFVIAVTPDSKPGGRSMPNVQPTRHHCSVCGLALCDHSDLHFSGIVPPVVSPFHSKGFSHA